MERTGNQDKDGENKNVLDTCQGRKRSLRGTTLLHPCLAAGALQSAGLAVRYSCAVTGAPVAASRGSPRRPRGSETMFGETFGARSQLPGLSVTYLPAYSSLHCLWCACEIVGSSLAQKNASVNTSYCTEEQWIKPLALSTAPDRTLILSGPGRSGAPAGGASGPGSRGGPAGWPHSRPQTG